MYPYELDDADLDYSRIVESYPKATDFCCDACGAEWRERHDGNPPVEPVIKKCPVCDPKVFCYLHSNIKGFIYSCWDKRFFKTGVGVKVLGIGTIITTNCRHCQELIEIPRHHMRIHMCPHCRKDDYGQFYPVPAKEEKESPKIKEIPYKYHQEIYDVMNSNKKAISDYLAGNKKALGPIIGILRKKLNLNPGELMAFLEKRLAA